MIDHAITDDEEHVIMLADLALWHRQQKISEALGESPLRSDGEWPK